MIGALQTIQVQKHHIKSQVKLPPIHTQKTRNKVGGVYHNPPKQGSAPLPTAHRDTFITGKLIGALQAIQVKSATSNRK